MALTLHPLARTTPRTRAELRAEDHSLSNAALARRYGVTAPTVRKWRARESTEDRSHRPDTLALHIEPGAGSGGHGNPPHVMATAG
jgi:DNA-binding transcriptional regulator YiaG